jgi:hypothetical protein
MAAIAYNVLCKFTIFTKFPQVPAFNVMPFFISKLIKFRRFFLNTFQLYNAIFKLNILLQNNLIPKLKGQKTASRELATKEELFGLENRRKTSQIFKGDHCWPFSRLFILLTILARDK